LIATPGFWKTACVSVVLFLLAGAGWAQTYTVGADNSAKPPAQANGAKSKGQSSGQTLGFGSNIQNARLGRAAELALQRGDRAQAVGYAQRATQAAPNDPQLWFLLGYAARLDGKYSLSVDAYSRGLRLAPSAVEGLSGLAQTYSVTGKLDEAKSLLTQVVSSYPKRRNDVLLLGTLYMQSGDYTQAIHWLDRAERLQPDARSEVLLALSFQRLKRMDTAKRYLEMAEKRAPDNPDVQRTLAGYYRETGDYASAIAALKSIRHPRPDVKAELAFTYQLAGDLGNAARTYAQAANAVPKDMGLQLSAAQAQVANGSISAASPFLRRAAALDANYYRLHAIRGEIAQLQDKDAEAVREYNAAVATLPASPVEGPLYGIQLHMDLMALYHNLDQENAAQQQLQIAQQQIGVLHEHGPDRAQFLRLRALIKMNAGQLDSALADIHEGLALNPHDPNSLQLNGDLLVKMGRVEDAIAVYKKVLAIDPRNRFALTSLGYASRTIKRDDEAKKYFEQLARDYPTLYIPYLALGDMYTAHREFRQAEASYKKAYALAPKNALIVAGGMNAAIEAQKLNLAQAWLDRASSSMRRQPDVLKERERYLRFKGDYAQSAAVGREAIQVLPHDRDVVVYLGYDLLQLGKYEELLQLTQKYSGSFPNEPDIPLLAGYVHKHNGQMNQALKDFTEALKRDPKVVTAYVNRGYVLNDLHQPEAAAKDFESAIKLDAKNGEAHLGLAYASLDSNKPETAIRESELAEKVNGDSEFVHLIRATAYGRQGRLTKSIDEYRAALKFAPTDGTIYLGLGNALFAGRRYHQAVEQLLIAQKYIPDNASVYALLARAYANLQDRQQTLQYIALAEQHIQTAPSASGGPSNASDIYVSTGEALSTLGDQRAAMERFQKALVAPNSDRINVRLAIASMMAQQDRSGDAQRQIALALMEGEAGETNPPTGTQLLQASDIFRQLHEYKLSETYLERARAAGASDLSVRIGMANTYLALGDTQRAAAELAAVNSTADSSSDYRFLLVQAAVYQQEHQGQQALTAFAQADSVAGEDQSAEQSLLQATADEGYEVNSHLSLLGNALTQGAFEPTVVYVLDSKLDGPTPVPPTDFTALPLPRYSIESQALLAYHLHFSHFMPASGFFQVNNARGIISVPATSSIQARDTNDYSLSIGVNPTVHLGTNLITFNSGIQGTIRRDGLSPLQLNQNLFRAFTYFSSSAFFHVVSATGYVIFDTGPFTESNIHSRSLAASLNFRVGAPWGKTALVTGWGANDQQFTPVGIEDYYTSSYIGLTHRFSAKWNVEGLVEDLRAWRVVGINSGIAQALRPAATVDFAPTRRWDIEATGTYSSTRGFHAYDDTQNGVVASYVKAFHRGSSGENGDLSRAFPIRFSAGVQQQTFFNFSHGRNQTFRPYFGITIF
jgi:tetratricopeptide (TPR) repeat protein